MFLPVLHILMLGHLGSVQRSDANPVVKPVVRARMMAVTNTMGPLIEAHSSKVSPAATTHVQPEAAGTHTTGEMGDDL